MQSQQRENQRGSFVLPAEGFGAIATVRTGRAWKIADGRSTGRAAATAGGGDRKAEAVDGCMTPGMASRAHLSIFNEGEKTMKFRKKPVIIEAFRVGHDRLWPDWFHAAVTKNDIITHGLGKLGKGEKYCEIKTLEGVMRANDGDYIIQGIQGEIYPCKPDIFAATYEPAPDSSEGIWRAEGQGAPAA